jgi:hypothetical protein
MARLFDRRSGNRRSPIADQAMADRPIADSIADDRSPIAD